MMMIKHSAETLLEKVNNNLLEDLIRVYTREHVVAHIGTISGPRGGPCDCILNAQRNESTKQRGNLSWSPS